MSLAFAPAAGPAGDLLWTSRSLLAHADFRGPLPDDVAAEFLAWLALRPQTTVATFRWHAPSLPRLAAFGERLRAHLLGGTGVRWLTGLDALDLSAEHQRCFYVAIGCALGTPLLHYGRLYEVVDRGASYTTQSVPVSMTNAETCFHTDSSSVDVVPDFVGLLCEQPSLCGGDSLVSNALRVHEVLRQDAPEVLELLRRPWFRDLVTPGANKGPEDLLRNRFPVFSDSERPGGVTFRYMRYWLERGQEKAGQPLQPEHLRAFDTLDALLSRDDHVVRFRLAAGDVLWVNNRTLAHNRTAYRDTPDNVRRLQRMWIDAGSAAGA